MNPIRVLLVGAGSRGAGYAACLQRLGDRVQLVGVAEPRDAWRKRIVRTHEIPEDGTFCDWADPLGRARIADAVIIATPDRMHAEPAIAYAQAGYHILLEKPLAPTAAECRQIVRAVKECGVLFAVCHVLRYAPYTRKLKSLIDDGCIGRPVSVQHLEPVGYWHQAHSFVRGNWRNREESSFMLLSKSCHDIDWLSHIMGSPPKRVASFGSLLHFRPENAPEGAADRCLDCSVEPDCPYSAKRVYSGLVAQGCQGWPLDVLTEEITRAGVERALRNGPYGRCVYRCDNDVVDHQVVSFEFAGGQTGSMTMTAFTQPHQHRQTRIFGTHGEIYCDCEKIEVFDFLTETKTTNEIRTYGGANSHVGGDETMIESFVTAVAQDDPARLSSGTDETLATHLAVFAAERSRREGHVIEVDSLSDGDC